MTNTGLFGQEITESKTPTRRYASPDLFGSGPKGKTCGKCKHRCTIEYHNKNYQKCGLMKHYWSHGPGTDIKCKDEACKYWEKDL